MDADTEYDVKVTAIYPDEAESEDLIGSARTCKSAAGGSEELRHISLKSHVTSNNGAAVSPTSLSSVEVHEG